VVRSAAALTPEIAARTTPAEIDDILRSVLLEHILNAASALAARDCPSKCPEWFIVAAMKPMDSTLNDASGTVKARAKHFETIFNAMCEETTRQVAQARRG
jgi:hypothetical protein